MSFRITFYGPHSSLWARGMYRFEYRLWRVWFYRPDEGSTGGVGFQVPFLHVCFTWGFRRSV